MAYLFGSSVVAALWWTLRRTRQSAIQPSSGAGSDARMSSSGENYGPLERGLHWLALASADVRRLAFELDRVFALPQRPTAVMAAVGKVPDPADGAVYVCGLARSGTTLLLRILNQCDEFRSLSYRDMPFVLAPNLWKQIRRYTPRPAVSYERAHGDGMFVDFDSPEGFEEVFWHTFGNRGPDSSCLGCADATPETLAAFADYRALVANPRPEWNDGQGTRHRYLSKNNNNLLRLRSLSLDPTATVLLLYRDPIATARSLHHQHQRFCATQTEDRFTQTYMGWLVHHEFGLDHLPFCFAVLGMDASRTPEDPNYWLDYWNAVYLYVLAQQELQLFLINYDELCAHPTRMLVTIFAVLGVQADAFALSKQIVPPSLVATRTDGFCPELLCRAAVTYRDLLSSPKNLLRSTDLMKSK